MSETIREANGQELFDNWQKPPEVTVSTGQNQSLIPPGHHGLSYFPDEAICVCGARLRREPVFRSQGTRAE
jgi:hypothetical protein